MRILSIGRKLSYVLVGALGTYVVERLPGSAHERYANLDTAAQEAPARAAFVEEGMHPARLDVDARKLVSAFEGSRELRPAVRCAAERFDVVELGPDYRAVHHAFVDRMLDEQSQLMRHARMMPVMHDGRVTGVKLFGVRAGDSLFKLGFRNGDEVRDVNQTDIGDPNQMLEVYARLRNDQNVSAGVLRNGELVRLRFVIC